MKQILVIAWVLLCAPRAIAQIPYFAGTVGDDNTFSNYEYLGYTIPLGKSRSVTPMAGMLHSWLMDEDADAAAGLYVMLGQWNVYLWGNDLLKSHPRVIIGIDFAL